MKLNKFYLFPLFIIGEVLIVASYLHFGKAIYHNLVISNIIITTLIFSLLLVEFANPILDLTDETQAAIGGIGIRWLFTFFFILGSIGLIFYSFKIKHFDIVTYWIIEAALFFILLLGLFFSKGVAEKVSEVYHQEKVLRSQLNEIKVLAEEIKFLLETNGSGSIDVISELKKMMENIRYLAPSNNLRATELESQILNDLNLIKTNIQQHEFDKAIIIDLLYRCDLVYKQRKNILSN